MKILGISAFYHDSAALVIPHRRTLPDIPGVEEQEALALLLCLFPLLEKQLY